MGQWRSRQWRPHTGVTTKNKPHQFSLPHRASTSDQSLITTNTKEIKVSEKQLHKREAALKR